jgi:hypothetical protein
MRKSCLLLALLSLAILPNLAEAGAWAQPQGERYLKLSFISYDADEHFNASGDRGPSARSRTPSIVIKALFTPSTARCND